jgi:hypothetical protein
MKYNLLENILPETFQRKFLAEKIFIVNFFYWIFSSPSKDFLLEKWSLLENFLPENFSLQNAE